MTEREKVIKGLEVLVNDMQEEVDDWEGYTDDELSHGTTVDCNWFYNGLQSAKAALALLKAQEPHLLTKDDFNDNPNMDEQGFLPVWREYKDNDIFDGWDCVQIYSIARQGDGCRMWTSKPSDELMKKVKWE